MSLKKQPLEDHLLQISVPNSTSEMQFSILIQAFMKATRLSFPEKDQYWASNVVVGVGRGTKGLVIEVCRGVSGVLVEPIKGAKKWGFSGGIGGFLFGLACLVGRPMKGVFHFVS